MATFKISILAMLAKSQSFTRQYSAKILLFQSKKCGEEKVVKSVFGYFKTKKNLHLQRKKIGPLLCVSSLSESVKKTFVSDMSSNTVRTPNTGHFQIFFICTADQSKIYDFVVKFKYNMYVPMYLEYVADRWFTTLLMPLSADISSTVLFTFTFLYFADKVFAPPPH